MPASFPSDFHHEGRQLAGVLLDALRKAVHDLAAVNVAKLSSIDRRRWATQSIRLAQLLANAFPPEPTVLSDPFPKPSPRKGLRKQSAAVHPASHSKNTGVAANQNESIEGPSVLGKSDLHRPPSPNSELQTPNSSPPTPPRKTSRSIPPRTFPESPNRLIFRSLNERLAPAKATALADRILGPPDG